MTNENRTLRLAMSGTYSTGKTTTTEALSMWVGVPPDSRLVKDGHRPVSEEFRALSDRLLVQILTELNIKFHVVSGNV